MLVGARRKKTSQSEKTEAPKKEGKRESAENYIQTAIEKRDYTGASTFIDFVTEELHEPYDQGLAQWNGYALFHSGQYSDAIKVYEKLLKDDPEETTIHLFIASCHFYNEDFEKAKASALRGPSCDLRTRLVFHIAHQLNDEQDLLQAHSQLIGTLENQLSLAAIHYMRSHYQDAVDIYERLLNEHPEFLALSVYIGMCNFRLDKWEEANEAVDLYLGENSDSAVALNLKACGYFRMFDSEIAESQILQIRKFASASYNFVDGLVTHNLCVFHGGVDGFKVLPKLVGLVPEAKYNLAVLYMRESDHTEANEVLQDYEPVELNETILKGTVLLAMGQANTDAPQIDEANSIFAEIGAMETVRDTIPGRQCLASTKFIIGEYGDTLRVLQTIEEHIGDLDEFNYNKGMTLASLSKWDEAERYLLSVTNQTYTREIPYTSWLCRCYIKNKKLEEAWALYAEATSTDDSKVLLNVIAGDCFAIGEFYYAMKAYDVLYKYEMDPHHRDGLIASAVGVFRGVLTKKEEPDKLTEVINALSSEESAADVLQTIRQYSWEAEGGYG